MEKHCMDKVDKTTLSFTKKDRRRNVMEKHCNRNLTRLGIHGCTDKTNKTNTKHKHNTQQTNTQQDKQNKHTHTQKTNTDTQHTTNTKKDTAKGHTMHCQKNCGGHNPHHNTALLTTKLLSEDRATTTI